VNPTAPGYGVNSTVHEAKLEMWSGGLYALGSPLPAGATSPTYFKSLRHHWIHQHAIGCAQVLIMVAIISASFIWRSKRLDGRFWRGFLFWAEWVVLLFVVAGIAGRLWLPEYNGLTQRITYFGFYLWTLVIVREIVRQKKTQLETRNLTPNENTANEEEMSEVTDIRHNLFTNR
jgi:FtsH-binding integral membrane protein